MDYDCVHSIVMQRPDVSLKLLSNKVLFMHKKKCSVKTYTHMGVCLCAMVSRLKGMKVLLKNCTSYYFRIGTSEKRLV
jgi:hypothetical protein